jgi:hypothetical protein
MCEPRFWIIETADFMRIGFAFANPISALLDELAEPSGANQWIWNPVLIPRAQLYVAGATLRFSSLELNRFRPWSAKLCPGLPMRSFVF